MCVFFFMFFFFQAEDGIRDLVRSRGLGDVYKRQIYLYQIKEEKTDYLKHLIETFNYTLGKMFAIWTLSLIHI